MLDRRTFAVALSAVAVSAICLRPDVVRAGTDADNGWRAALRALVGKTDPVEGRLTFETPFVARNDTPFRVEVLVESPMTETDYVTAVHLFATECREPRIASFYFTPQSGRAMVSTRIRLERSQELIAAARMNDGAWYLGQRVIKISNSAYAP